jgi:hypothetical protein
VPAEISQAKNRLPTPDAYERAAGHPGAPLIAVVWRESETELGRCNAFERSLRSGSAIDTIAATRLSSA